MSRYAVFETAIRTAQRHLDERAANLDAAAGACSHKGRDIYPCCNVLVTAALRHREARLDLAEAVRVADEVCR